jgi:hypothetical protein
MFSYYVYIYLRKDGSPYYVGKGKGARWKKQHKIETPSPDRVIFPITQTTEEWAHFMEMEFIDLLGRLSDGTGILENKTDGGEGTSGKDPELRAHLSRTQKIAWQNSPERKDKLRKLGLSNRGKTYTQTQERIDAIKKGNRKNSKVYKITNGVDTWEMNVYDFSDLVDGNIKSIKQCVWRNRRYKNYTFS